MSTEQGLAEIAAFAVFAVVIWLVGMLVTWCSRTKGTGRRPVMKHDPDDPEDDVEVINLTDAPHDRYGLKITSHPSEGTKRYGQADRETADDRDS